MITLNSLIKDVAELCLDGNDPHSDEKKLRRRFNKFIESGGGSMDKLRGTNGHVEFEDEEAAFIRAILIQLAEGKGFAFKLMVKNRSGTPTLNDEHDFFQEIIDLMRDDGAGEEYIMANLRMLDRLFQLSFRQSIEYCHQLVDCVAINLLPYPYTHQVMLMSNFTELLKREFARTMGEAIKNSLGVAEVIRDMKELMETEDVGDFYGEDEDEIKSEYCQRDAALIAFLKADEEVRQLLEKRVGATIEEIWNVTTDSEEDE